MNNSINFAKYGEPITKEEALAFSEGNKKLYKLLLLCIKKDITTYTCCAGHIYKTYEEYAMERYSLNRTLNLNKLKNKDFVIKCYMPYFSINIKGNDKNFLCYLLEHKRLNNKIISIKIDHFADSITFRLIRFKNYPIKYIKKQMKNFYNNLLYAFKKYKPKQKYTSIKLSLFKLLRKNFPKISCNFLENKIFSLIFLPDTKFKINGFEIINHKVNLSYLNKDGVTTKQVLLELINNPNIIKNKNIKIK